MSGELVVSGVSTDVAGRLANIYRAKGKLSEGDVLADARKKSSPLHSFFEWDDTAAAERYRLEQAASLIRRVKVTVIPAEDADPVQVRAYVAMREIAQVTDDVAPGSYVAIQDVAGQTAYELSLRDSMRRDVARLQKRYENTSLLFEVAREVWGT